MSQQYSLCEEPISGADVNIPTFRHKPWKNIEGRDLHKWKRTVKVLVQRNERS